ncbi:MAG: hypothetical protein M1826_002619 [Phylliscum demangeonii]|nr:MAG: hypothetical protein M1826_002619 [Phylliscum demangeonii]
MPTLAITNFNVVCSVLGGFITVFGLVSYLCKEKFYLSEALISLLAGIVFSPHGTNWIRPLEFAHGSNEALAAVTLDFTRLVLGVQLVLAGVQLPSRYVLRQWKTLALLLGPVMTCMWLASSLIIWGMVPKLGFLHALVIGACVTPTDPVLSNSIVKGKFADQYVPTDLQRIIVAESGANDGLGYPFLFLALYLLRYTGSHGLGQTGGAGKALGLWFGETWGYTILLSVAYGVAVGWLAKLFIVGTCGMIGTDDVLACFVAGNAFTIDDWFRLETMEDSLQPTIDMLLNLSIFMWFGAVCPWSSFVHNDHIPIYRLIFLGILVLLFRRLPIVFAIHKYIPQIEQTRQAAFVGFFGPIGVSAVFYLYICLDYLKEITVDGRQRDDARRLAETMTVVIWFLAVCSIVVHGLTIPLGKIGLYLPRSISHALDSSSNQEPEPFRVQGRLEQVARDLVHGRGLSLSSHRASRTASIERPVFRPGGSVIRPGRDPEGPTRPPSTPLPPDRAGSPEEGAAPLERTIRFPDEPPLAKTSVKEAPGLDSAGAAALRDALAEESVPDGVETSPGAIGRPSLPVQDFLPPDRPHHAADGSHQSRTDDEVE